MNRFTALFTLLILTGCATSQESAETLRDTTKRVHTYCSEQSPTEVFKLLAKKMSACYVGTTDIPISAGGVFTYASTSTKIEAQYREGSTSDISVSVQGGLAPRVYGVHVTIAGSDTCHSSVTVYILNKFWENRADQIRSWLNNEDVDCSYY